MLFIEYSYRDFVYKVFWIQFKIGIECFFVFLDGQVLWWDIRKMGEFIEKLYLDLIKKQDFIKVFGVMVLEYELIMVCIVLYNFVMLLIRNLNIGLIQVRLIYRNKLQQKFFVNGFFLILRFFFFSL